MFYPKFFTRSMQAGKKLKVKNGKGKTRRRLHFVLSICQVQYPMSEDVLNRIRAALRETEIKFREIRHEPTLTSADSAAVRGEELGVGAKALLLKVDERFAVFVLPADRQLDSAAVRKHFAAKRVRFATADELRDLTGLVPGSLPPFGRPVLPFDLFAEVSIGIRHDRVAFNAGSLTDSIVMSAADWEAIAKPTRFRFAKEVQ
jgi:prolyl-tRNA editing enzyme YbaK/EbsC (Cys-tRNA(Pro) deacylase)